jgi:chromosome partitioning protein
MAVASRGWVGEGIAMAIIITVAQQKGGAGKTMLAANLAAAWAGAHRVTLLDIDPQHSLEHWHGLRAIRSGMAEIGFSAVSGWRVKGELDRLAAGADILIVDTPPQIDSDAARAIRAASLVVIPVQPSMPDLWASAGTLKLVTAERRRVAVVLNRTPAKSALRSTVEGAFAKSGLPVLPATLGDRRAFPQAFAQGMGVTEAQPRSVAAAELSALADAILEIAR